MVNSDFTWVMVAGIFCLTLIIISVYYIESKKKKSSEGKIRDPLLRSILLWIVAEVGIILMLYYEVLPPNFNEEYWWIHVLLPIVIIAINIAIFIYSTKKPFKEIKKAVVKFLEEELEDDLIGSTKIGNYLIQFKEIDVSNSAIANFIVRSDKLRSYLIQIDIYSLRVVGCSSEILSEDKKELKKHLIPNYEDDVTRRARTLLDEDKKESEDEE